MSELRIDIARPPELNPICSITTSRDSSSATATVRNDDVLIQNVRSHHGNTFTPSTTLNLSPRRSSIKPPLHLLRKPTLIMILIPARPQNLLLPNGSHMSRSTNTPRPNQQNRHRSPNPQNPFTHNRIPNLDRTERESYVRKHKRPPHEMETHALFRPQSSVENGYEGDAEEPECGRPEENCC